MDRDNRAFSFVAGHMPTTGVSAFILLYPVSSLCSQLALQLIEVCYLMGSLTPTFIPEEYKFMFVLPRACLVFQTFLLFSFKCILSSFMM